MSPQQRRGQERDEAIRALAAEGPVSARQVAAALFPGRDGLHAARRRLQVLSERGEVVRDRLADVGWVYGLQRGQLGRKTRHGLQVSELHLRLLRAGILREWAREVPLPTGQADARSVLAGVGEVWWEVERDRGFDRWDLYGPGTGRTLAIWTTDALAKRTHVPEGVRAVVGGWGEDPAAMVRRLPGVAQEAARPTLRAELAGVRREEPAREEKAAGALVWRLPPPMRGAVGG